MKRFNYLAPRHVRLPSGLPTLAIDNRIRGPLAVLLLTLILTAVLSVVQVARLRTAQQAYEAASARVALDEHALDAVASLRVRVSGLEHLEEAVASTHRASVVEANELVWVGNHLPEHTWLSALRYADGAYALEGTSDRAEAIGEAIVALRDDAHGLVPRLVSLRDDPRANGPRLSFSLRLTTR